jgi:hypothetical protein
MRSGAGRIGHREAWSGGHIGPFRRRCCAEILPHVASRTFRCSSRRGDLPRRSYCAISRDGRAVGVTARHALYVFAQTESIATRTSRKCSSALGRDANPERPDRPRLPDIPVRARSRHAKCRHSPMKQREVAQLLAPVGQNVSEASTTDLTSITWPRATARRRTSTATSIS